ncbi:MAG TPA: DUF5666 domain-containing protein [Thermoanaerobaculia bacterium]|nr:DUF5666 domain-containing protein [Thermoanaerobaculia bacterium]
MRRTLHFSMVYVIVALAAVSTFAQTGSSSGTSGAYVGTVIDLENGRGRLQIEPDDDRYARTTIETDSVSTQDHGFGTMIAGKPEIFTGSSGFSNLRIGDRISVRGAPRGDVIRASAVTLLGRPVAAGTVGIGQTRSPESVATQTDDRVTGTTPPASNTTEGTVRQINLDEGRIVIQTENRRMITVNTYRNTPVWFRGEQHRITNLEIGDRIRVEVDPRSAQTDEVTARRIEVTQSVQEARGTESQGGTVTSIEGRVVRAEAGLDYAYIQSARGEIRVDMSQAEDARGDRIHARDLRAGDLIEISGNYSRAGDIFHASTVRLNATDTRGGTAGSGSSIPVYGEDEYTRYSIVTFSGTVRETLEDAATIGIHDTEMNRQVRVYVADDFAVRTKATTAAYVNANTLKVGDTVLIKAYTDTRGNLIAQTIRLRNR